MFREMRRSDKSMTPEEIQKVLEEGQYGCLSVIGDEGWPYGVFVNYGYTEGKLYFHTHKWIDKSHKLSAIQQDPRVCFSIETRHDMVPEELNTYFESVVVFGRARIITEDPERWEALDKMMGGLAPEFVEFARRDCEGDNSPFAMVEITPEHVTGKIMREASPLQHMIRKRTGAIAKHGGE